MGHIANRRHETIGGSGILKGAEGFSLGGRGEAGGGLFCCAGGRTDFEGSCYRSYSDCTQPQAVIRVGAGGVTHCA